jgi:uncharacterized membrane protein
MNDSMAYAVGALLFYGLADFVYKRGAAAGAAPHQFMMVQTWFFNPCALLYGLISGTLTLNAASLWGAAAGVCAVVGYYNFAYSLRTGSVSTNATIFRLSFVVTVVLAVAVLGEPLTAPKLAGLTLGIGAVWLLLAAPSAQAAGAGRENKASLGRVLVATVMVGILSFTYKLGLRKGATPTALVVTQGWVAITLATGFTAYLDRRIRPGRAAWCYAPFAAVLLVIAFIFLAQGLKAGQASVVVPVAQMGFVVTALLGFLLLGEPFTLRKGAGLAVAVAALAFLAKG